MVNSQLIDILSPRHSGVIEGLLEELRTLSGVNAPLLEDPDRGFEVMVEASQPQETDAMVLGIVLIRWQSWYCILRSTLPAQRSPQEDRRYKFAQLAVVLKNYSY